MNSRWVSVQRRKRGPKFRNTMKDNLVTIPEKKPSKFKSLGWDQFEALGDSLLDYSQTEINGHTVWTVVNGEGRVFGCYYSTKHYGSVNYQESFKDVVEYCEADSLWPKDWL